MPDANNEAVPVVRIPSDVDQPDKIVAGLTARQVAVLASVAMTLWALYQACRPRIATSVFLPISAVVLLACSVLVTTKRDGVAWDRLAAAAFHFHRSPKRLVLAPEGLPGPPHFLAAAAGRRDRLAPFESPVHEVTEPGVVDLGRDGVSSSARCSTVNLALRSPAEQAVLLGSFGAWLNSLTGALAITVRSSPTDLSAVIGELSANAERLPNTGLAAAAREHAAFLADLTAQGQVLTRDVILTVHEGSTAATARLQRRVTDAAALLAGCEVSVQHLSASEAAALLDDSFNPSSRSPERLGRKA